MDIPKQLALKMCEYIKTQDNPVTMTYLIERGTGKHDMQTVLKAISILNRMHELQVASKSDDVYYSRKVTAISTPHEEDEFKKYRQQLEDEYNKMCASLTPKQSAYADSVFEGVGEFVRVGNSYVPASNVEHYKKVLGRKSRTTRR